MFRPFKSIVTIITASEGPNSHYASLGSGVKCHVVEVAMIRLRCGFRAFRDLCATGWLTIDLSARETGGAGINGIRLQRHEWPGGDKGKISWIE
jgi:hypothetical protein